MKALISIITFTIIFSLSGISQNANKQAEANPNAPKIVFTNTTHNYGNLSSGDDGNCEFRFKNEGKEPLILSNVVSSCGCTVAEWPREPIMQGKTAAIKVNYDTKRVGPINKSITVNSNASNGSVYLKITGNVVQANKEALPINKPTAPFAN